MSDENVTGLFTDADNAREAVDRLLNASFRTDEIGVLMSEKHGTAPVRIKHETEVGTGMAAGSARGGLLGDIIVSVPATGERQGKARSALEAAGAKWIHGA